MVPISFDYHSPASLDKALEALVSFGDDAKVIAGGQSLLPLMKLRLAQPRVLIDISKIKELASIHQEDDQIIMGALCTHYQVESSELLEEKCPLLCQTAGFIGDSQVRNRGTVGGSLAHADPAADLPAAFLALGAELQVNGSEGNRRIQAEEFFYGVMTTALKPTEILTAIKIPLLSGRTGTSYQKMEQKASGFAIVGVAAVVTLNEEGICSEVSLGVTGVGLKPFRARAVEEKLKGKRLNPDLIESASAEATQGVDALSDIHASAEFRAHLARVYTARALGAALKKAESRS